MKVVLLITHLLALGAGFYICRPERSATAAIDEDAITTSSRRRVVSTLPADVNPITHATSDDYRRALTQHLAEVGDVIDLERYLREWVKIDPDAALLSLAGIYGSDRVENLLSNLEQNSEVSLAAALVRNYGEFDSIAAYKVRSIMGRAIAKLAQKDLDAALALLAQIPVSPEDLPYQSVIDALDGPGLREFFEKTSGPDLLLKFPDDRNYWEAAASRAWRVLSPTEYRELFTQFDHPVAFKRLIQGALQEVRYFEKNEAFVEIFDSLPSAKQEVALQAFRKNIKLMSAQNKAAMREVADRRGATALIEAIDSAPR